MELIPIIVLAKWVKSNYDGNEHEYEHAFNGEADLIVVFRSTSLPLLEPDCSLIDL